LNCDANQLVTFFKRSFRSESTSGLLLTVCERSRACFRTGGDAGTDPSTMVDNGLARSTVGAGRAKGGDGTPSDLMTFHRASAASLWHFLFACLARHEKKQGSLTDDEAIGEVGGDEIGLVVADADNPDGTTNGIDCAAVSKAEWFGVLIVKVVKAPDTTATGSGRDSGMGGREYFLS